MAFGSMIEVDIQPYLNPNYWDGHSLGVGEIDAGPPRTCGIEVSDERFARRSIARSFLGGPLSITHSYRNGDTFDVSDYDPGSVVMLRDEALTGAPLTPESLERLASQTLPERPTDTVSHTEDRGRMIAGMDIKGFTYLSMVNYGIVAKKARSQDLIIVPAFDSHPSRKMSWFLPTPMAVGAITHKRTPENDWDMIRRINIIQAIDSKMLDKRKKSLPGFLGRLSLGYNH